MKKYNLIILLYLLLPVSILAQNKSIHEEKFITIGGIEQWITINGDDHSKPVILFLHGGPGSTMSPYDNTIYGGWEKNFILVQWDQRGSGRTFGRNAPVEINEDYWVENPLSVEQMTDDGIALSKYLIQYLGTKKIIILGTSWGSVLGTKMALKNPALFHAYVGHSQIVNPSENLLVSYNKIYKMAQKAYDQESIDTLRSIGIPPYINAKNAGQLFRIIKKYERKNSIPVPNSWWKIASKYDNAMDSKDREDGDDYSFINYIGHKQIGIKGIIGSINFLESGLNFKIPIYLIQGEEDILTPKEITISYFDKIKAPKKEFFLVPGAAHGCNQSIIDTQYKIIKEHIVSLIDK
ncbi:alpha/beta hydrolase family protein [Flavobacterium sp. LB2P44]|uniref:alpha/beta hydrolase family protein n=1 Tax=Flavobacterium sp. LB2P44 TaxID=3401713 RepID=UPI003AB08ECA